MLHTEVARLLFMGKRCARVILVQGEILYQACLPGEGFLTRANFSRWRGGGGISGIGGTMTRRNRPGILEFFPILKRALLFIGKNASVKYFEQL